MEPNASWCKLLLKDDIPSISTLYPSRVCWKYRINRPINYASRKTPCVRTLQLGLGVQIHRHFSSRLVIDSLHVHELHSLHNEIHWFEVSAFLISGADIPNVNPGFRIQHEAETLDYSISYFDHNPCNGNNYQCVPWRKYQCKCLENHDFARYWSCQQSECQILGPFKH